MCHELKFRHDVRWQTWILKRSFKNKIFFTPRRIRKKKKRRRKEKEKEKKKNQGETNKERRTKRKNKEEKQKIQRETEQMNRNDKEQRNNQYNKFTSAPFSSSHRRMAPRREPSNGYDNLKNKMQNK